MISFLDVKAAYDELRPEIDRAIARVCASGRYILGPEVERFEDAFASHVEAAHCVGVGNGLDALVLILRALGIGPGDEVIVPAQTFVATWLAVSWAGATPVPVEVDTDGALISPEAIEAAITPRTKAVMPVHLFGHPADLDPICEIAGRHAIAVIEDAAQAHGARYKGKRIGARGTAAAWSFYPAKNLGAMGDGGAVTTDDAALAERIRLLRNYGSAGKHVHQIAGVNSRLDPIQAAIMAEKLPRLEAWNSHRRRIAAFYLEALADLPIDLPEPADWAEPVWHLFAIRCAQRDRLAERLRRMGVATGCHYPVVPYRQGAYAGAAGAASFPIAEDWAARCLSLPIGPHLELRDAERVADAVRSALQEAGS